MTEGSQLTPSQAEKCPACGSPAVLYKIRIGLEEQPEVEAHARQLWLACMDCNHRWPAESDRVAHP